MTDAPRDPQQISDLNPDPIVEFTEWFEAAKAAGAHAPEARDRRGSQPLGPSS